MKRRDFIRNMLVAGAAVQFPHIWIKKADAQTRRFRITLMQTNDTHSRIDPFPMDGSRNQGLGGIARRATLAERIRRQNPYSLLLDGGDSLQGTPYFNLFKGEVEFRAMTRCGYDASTLGNHEFDNGSRALAEALNYAGFDFVNCNYEFTGTPLKEKVKRFITRDLGPVRVGITGVGIDFMDLVMGTNHQGVEYREPFKPAQAVVDYLRKDLGCSLVVVLSHLGYKPHGQKPGDTDLAYEVNGIDWIVGGHSHTFMDEPDVIVSKGKHTTRILQVGWGGILLGKTDFSFEGDTLAAVDSRVLAVDEQLPAAAGMSDLMS